MPVGGTRFPGSGVTGRRFAIGRQERAAGFSPRGPGPAELARDRLPPFGVFQSRQAVAILIGGAGLLLAACRTPDHPSPGEAIRSSNERHTALFGNFELPRKLGSVENVNLQIPTISPDGSQILYLRTDRDYVPVMTLLGSPDPQDTPPEGTLAIWIRPVSGTAPGRRLSQYRWAHSPVWSDSGRSIAYVVNEPPASFIVHVDPATGQEHLLGVPDAVNCLPRFDGDDQTLLFCSGDDAHGPFRVFRQALGEPEPAALTPEGMDCVLPVLSDPPGKVLCARAEAGQLNWAWCSLEGSTDLAMQCGMSERPRLLETWAGITSPLSPDRRSFLAYDPQQERITACHVGDRRVARHRQGSIAACWLTSEAIALATSEWVFVVNTATGMSPGLFNGQWIPCRYVPAARRLLLLGKDSARRFSIVEVVFKPR